MCRLRTSLFLAASLAGSAFADPPVVESVRAEETSAGEWRFAVELSHPDTGWDHYASVWRIIHPKTEEVLGERVLAHPHVNEQPFTRSLGGVEIPSDLDKVWIIAGDNLGSLSAPFEFNLSGHFE